MASCRREKGAARRASLAVKRGFDVLFAAALLVLLAPLLLLVGLAVRLTSPGPIIFRQERLGRHGVPFTCLKFRSMYANSPDLRNPDGSTYNAADDARVTPVGRFLRRSSLDELPQLINVLKGDMSIVGPRPDIVEILPLYRPGDEKRLEVRPGITGWAAIHGRNALPLDRRRDLDLEYVEHFCLLLDLQILIRTIPSVLLGEGLFVPRQAEKGNVHARD